MGLLVNVDVPDLTAAIAFYETAFGLSLSRRLGTGVAELSGWPVLLYLLENPEGSTAAGADRRRYSRHWTPVHLDIVVDDVDEALQRAIAAGARLEQGPRTETWGRIATLADPFGHGLCLIAFIGRGYDEIAVPRDTRDRP